MLKTVKSKIILLTVSMLIILSIMFFCFAYSAYKNDCNLLKIGCDLKIQSFAKDANTEIIKLQENVFDLALMGKLFYEGENSPNLIENIVQKNFEAHNHLDGGGIWFEPNHTQNIDDFNCAYAFRNKQKKLVLDKTFKSKSYDYLHQNWYKEVSLGLKKGKTLVWTTPYKEEIGTKTFLTTVGAGIFDKNEKLVGLATVDLRLDNLIKEISDMRPTPNSFGLFADTKNDFILVTNDNNINGIKLIGKSIKNIPWFDNNRKNASVFEYNGKKYIYYTANLTNGMVFVINVPEKELYKDINKRLFYMVILLLFASSSVTAVVYFTLKHNVNKPIDKLINIAKDIGKGKFNTEIEIENPEEFSRLAKTFNRMIYDIRKYTENLTRITEEKERIESDLTIAKSIQSSSLPNVFPAYPSRKEFDIYALMDAAKEVGGDFYDFFFIDNDRFMFLVADISGKGIPAALFMMTIKTRIKNLAKAGFTLEEIAKKVNKKMCRNKDTNFFITMFACIIDLTTGESSCLNCGHNPPMLKKKSGEYKYLSTKPNFVIGAINEAVYESEKLLFETGDKIFLYTDGVTEAINNNEEFFGEKRLEWAINGVWSENETLKETVINIKNKVEEFSQWQEQSDDMTMLLFQYNGYFCPCIFDEETKQTSDETNKIKTYLLPAEIDRYSCVKDWIESACNEIMMREEDKNQIILATEEVYVNIASYAYTDENKKRCDVEIIFKILEDNTAEIQFIDTGKPYNPLEKEDPDITLDANERQIGGLGIYMIKNIMNSIEYKYENNKNILTMRKIYSTEE